MNPVTSEAEAVADTHQTACCVVGGGPAGMVLALLLARKACRSRYSKRTTTSTEISGATRFIPRLSKR